MAQRVGDTEQPRDRVVERVRDKVTERVRDTEQLRQSGQESERHRAAERKRERDRKKEGCACSVRGRIRISKITILPLKNIEINPKENLVTFWPGIHLPACTAGFCQYEADTAGIFTCTKQRGILYRYGIFWPYQPIQYGIHFLD